MPVLNTLLLERIRRAYLPWQRPAVPVYPGTPLERAAPFIWPFCIFPLPRTEIILRFRSIGFHANFNTERSVYFDKAVYRCKLRPSI